MIENFNTIQSNCSYEIVEKKSRFIANIFPISNEKQAQEIILKVKKENIQARHNVFAYRVIDDEKIIDKFTILPVAPTFAEAIERIYEDKPVSPMFG